MKVKLSAILLILVMVLGLLPSAALAASPPATISEPENIGVSNYGGGAVHCTLSAPDDLRALISQTEKERGFGMTIRAQVDFKTDNGNWHYSSDWDNIDTYRKYTLNYYNPLHGGDEKQFLGHERLVFKTMFPDETNVPLQAAFNSFDWYKSHSITFRARFAIDFYNKNIVFSDWSSEYVLSGNNKMDYKTIMNTYAPTLITSRLEENARYKKPFVVLSLGKHPNEIQKFNAASGNSMRTEVWLIAPDADYSTSGAPTFTDQADISGWALNDCLYIAKLGIIKGSDGKFMPRAITQAQTAAGFANTSREQALAMSVRSVDKVNEIK